MSRIFLSHSSCDDFEAVALHDWLAAEGWQDVFLDLDPDRGIAAGERWERSLHEAASRCEAVLFLVSANWLASDWCLKEYTVARRLNKKLFAVLVDPTKTVKGLPTALTDTWQVVDLAGGQDMQLFRALRPGSHEEKHVGFSRDGLARLKRGLQKAGLDPRFFAWPPEDEPQRAPYRGLKPLEKADAGIFFGRDAPIVEATDKLRGLRIGAPPRLLVVLGASGAGKSSFLRAGLLPRLARDDAHFLPLPPIRPERAAIFGENGLLRSLEASCPTRTRADLRAAILAGAVAIRPILSELAHKAFRQTLADAAGTKPPAIVIAIDQAEELFRAEGSDEGQALLECVRDLVCSDDPAVIVIFAIRSDTYDALEHAKSLEGLSQSPLALLPMPRGAYKEVIEGPVLRAAQTGGKLAIEPRLTERLLEDIEKGGGSDALPLLAFVLEQLYLEYYRAGELTLADYEAVGGFKGAIDAAVERAFARAESDGRIPRERAARELLLRRGLIPWLAGIDPDTRSPRRNIARRDDIPAEAVLLIDLLVEERLLSTDSVVTKDPLNGEVVNVATIEPTHEALLRQWGLLDGWLAQDLGLLATLEGVKRAARDWDANARDEAWLAHQGQRLADSQSIDARSDIAAKLDTTDRAYIAACQKRQEAIRRETELRRLEREAEQERRVTDARRELNRSRWVTAVTLVLLLFATIGGGVAWWERRVASTALAHAEANYKLALDQAAGSVRLLTESYEVGGIHTKLMLGLIERAQNTINSLSESTDDIVAARAQFFDVLSRADISLGRVSLAEDFARKERILVESLISKDKYNTRWQELKATAQQQYGIASYWRGDLASAVRELTSSRLIIEGLLRVHPLDKDLNLSLIWDDLWLGDSFRAQGRTADAAGTYDVMLETIEQLTRLYPSDLVWVRAATFGFQRQGDYLESIGQPKSAILKYRRFLDDATKLFNLDPSNMLYRQAVSVAHERIADALYSAKSVAEALAEYRTYFRLASELLAVDQANFSWHQDLEVAHQRIGDLFLSERNLIEATSEFGAYLQMTLDALSKDEENGAAMYDVANARQKVGDVLRAQGSFQEALQQYRESMTTADQLIQTDKSNAIWQKLVAMGHQRLGIVMLLTNDLVGATEQISACINVPVQTNIWSPRNLWPADVHAFCLNMQNQLQKTARK